MLLNQLTVASLHKYFPYVALAWDALAGQEFVRRKKANLPG